MDDLVFRKLIALNQALERMYWQERLRELIDQLDAEIATEHSVYRINGMIWQKSVLSPEAALFITACS